jgi:transposase
MSPLFRYRLSDREKDALLSEQAAWIERLAARVVALEALLAKPKKTSQNSHTPLSQDRKAGGAGGKETGKRRKPRPSRPGLARPLRDAPDETIKRLATACPHCAPDVSGQTQTCRRRYDHISRRLRRW